MLMAVGFEVAIEARPGEFLIRVRAMVGAY